MAFWRFLYSKVVPSKDLRGLPALQAHQAHQAQQGPQGLLDHKALLDRPQ
ncbi:MAG: hypothetical protein NVS1B13_07490 [Flavisolibacter sp.]